MDGNFIRFISPFQSTLSISVSKIFSHEYFPVNIYVVKYFVQINTIRHPSWLWFLTVLDFDHECSPATKSLCVYRYCEMSHNCFSLNYSVIGIKYISGITNNTALCEFGNEPYLWFRWNKSSILILNNVVWPHASRR